MGDRRAHPRGRAHDLSGQQAVEVKWKCSWYPATVLDAHSGIHQIQYDGYGPEWNEWVALKRIRQA
jgi:hypothetical protein